MKARQRYVGLDHIRAIAAFMVFTWHFAHAGSGFPVPFQGAPNLFPLSLLDEGHTGVALFMVLSGYLFTKIVNGRQILYGPFFIDRVIRLAPVLIVAIVLTALVGFAQAPHSYDLSGYLLSIVDGVVRPTLPSGGWSITVEAHFYIILPLLLAATARWKWAPVALVGIAIAFRSALYLEMGGIQDVSYWTIIGHIDQFLLGIFAFHIRSEIQANASIAFATIAGFVMVFSVFDQAGGFYGAAKSPFWIVLPTLEAIAYAALIAWYDGLNMNGNSAVSRVVALYGECSYSIYLLHPLLVFREAKFIHEHIMRINNMYVAFCWSLVCFAAMLPIGYLSFRFIEKPVRDKWHRKYLTTKSENAGMVPA